MYTSPTIHETDWNKNLSMLNKYSAKVQMKQCLQHKKFLEVEVVIVSMFGLIFLQLFSSRIFFRFNFQYHLSNNYSLSFSLNSAFIYFVFLINFCIFFTEYFITLNPPKHFFFFWKIRATARLLIQFSIKVK